MMRRAIIAAALLVAAAGAAQAQSIAAVRTAAGGLDVDTANVVSVMPESLWTNCVLWIPASRDGAGTYYNYSQARLDGVQAVTTNRPAWTNAGLGSYTFDGASDYIDITSVTGVMASLTKGTVAFWTMLLTNKDAFLPLVSFTRSSPPRYEVWFMADLRVANNKRWDAFCLYNDTVVWRYVGTNNSALSGLDVWNHFVVSHNGTGPEVFLNGASMAGSFIADVDRSKWLDDVMAANAVAAIGRANVVGSLYWGKTRADDIRIFNRALTALEIGTMYTNTSRGKL